MVYEQNMVTASTASGTVSQIEEKPRLQLSLSQVRDAEDHCLTGEVIGITTTGSLLMNGSASTYGGSLELTLIGYALDGFPIYGVKSDVSVLDNCGGEQTSLGYRYYLRAGEPFILGCFAATPANFTNY